MEQFDSNYIVTLLVLTYQDQGTAKQVTHSSLNLDLNKAC